MTARRFALIDRDGTLIAERNYLATVAGLELLPNSVAGLQRLTELNIGLIVVSNQSGLARGYFDQAALDAIHDRLRELLRQGNVTLDGIYTCPHVDEDGCSCRKPKPGLALRAAAEHGFEPAKAFVIGDKACDIDLGRAIGATTLLVRTGYGAQAEAEVGPRADYVVADLSAAAEVIASMLRI